MKWQNLIFLTLLSVLFISMISGNVFAKQYYYWIQHDENGNPSGDVWVNVSIPAGQSVTLSVMNGTSNDAAYLNGDDVFDFFDDFNGNSLDSSKWPSYDQIASVSGSKVSFYHYISSKNLDLNNKIITSELEVSKLDTGNTKAWEYIIQNTSQNKGYRFVNAYWTGYSDFGYNPDSSTTKYNDTGVAFDHNFHLMSLWSDSSNTFWKIDSTQGSASTLGLNWNQIEYYVDSDSTSDEITVDYVFVRKYASTPPTVSVTKEDSYYEVTITNPSSTDLTNYQVGIPISDLGITSETQSLKILDHLLISSDHYVMPSNIYVNTLTTQGFKLNATQQMNDSFDVTLLLLDGEHVVYNQSFTNLKWNSSGEYNYTIPQALAHHNLTFEEMIEDLNTTYIASHNITKTVLDTLPTQPTQISQPSQIFVNDTYQWNASGSTDIDGDNLTYYYAFYDSNGTLLQNWSTNNSFKIPISEAHRELLIEAKAYDGYNYSQPKVVSQYVSDTPPKILWLKSEEKNATKTDTVCFKWNATDIDNDEITYNIYLYGFGYWMRFKGNQIYDAYYNTSSFEPESGYINYSGVPVWQLGAAKSVLNTSYCFKIPLHWGFEEANIHGKYFDGFVYAKLVAKDVQNPVGDGQKEDVANEFNVTKYPLVDGSRNLGYNLTTFEKDNPNLIYVYSANITYCLINEIGWKNWLLNETPVPVAGFDLYRHGVIDTDLFTKPSGSGCELGTPVHRYYDIYLLPPHEYLVRFTLTGTTNNFAGVRSLILTQNGRHAHLPVVLINPKDYQYVVSPIIEYDVNPVEYPSTYEVYTWYGGKKYIISNGQLNSQSSEVPQFPLLYSNYYDFVLDGKDYGITAVTNPDYIKFKKNVEGYVMPEIPTKPIITVTPDMIYSGKNATINISFLDAANQYSYWGYEIILPNGSNIVNFTSHVTTSAEIPVLVNSSRYGESLKVNVYGFEAEPTIVFSYKNTTEVINGSQQNIEYKFYSFAGPSKIVETKLITISDYNIPSLSEIAKSFDNLFVDNAYLTWAVWLSVTIGLWILFFIAGLSLPIQILSIGISTVFFSGVFGPIITIVLFMLTAVLFVIAIMM